MIVGDHDMAVTVTLVFSDEAHREAWLIQNHYVPLIKDDAVAVEVLAEAPVTRERARLIDYKRRRNSQNLCYTVGPIYGPTLDTPPDHRTMTG